MAKKIELQRLYAAKTLDELKVEYDRFATDYEKWVLEDFGWRGHDLIADLVVRMLAPDAVILDAGAGSGLVGQALAQRGFNTIDGIDLSAEMLDHARRKGCYRNLVQGALGGPLDYASDSYDAVLASGVFTPGHAPPSSFDELIRATKPGGLIIFSLRDDVVPAGFPEKMQALVDAGAWHLVQRGERFRSSPKGEPEVHHRVWIYRVAG